MNQVVFAYFRQTFVTLRLVMPERNLNLLHRLQFLSWRIVSRLVLLVLFRETVDGQQLIEEWYDVLWMEVAKGTYLCQSFHCSLVLSFKILFKGPCDRSTAPIVCGCFNVACFNFISRSFVNSAINEGVKVVPKSVRIVVGR